MKTDIFTQTYLNLINENINNFLFEFPLIIIGVYTPVKNPDEPKPLFNNYAPWGEYSGKIVANAEIDFDDDTNKILLIANISKIGNGNFSIHNTTYEEASGKIIFEIDRNIINDLSAKEVIDIFKNEAINYFKTEYTNFIDKTEKKKYILTNINIRFNKKTIEEISLDNI